MATLVLGAIGTLVGGPLGGAIGATLGRGVDAMVIGAPRREGPRLKDLAVSTSSYGQPIPALFGTVRAPGTVIWSTDLAERSESSGGGKGKPKTTTYSYSVSLAVALSSRPIERIGRIWADGNLLRGSGGDLKTGGTLRVYSGHADQSPDPLMAADLGAQCPAYRGCAYVVFEDLALEDFGNRIPALSFEVFAGSARNLVEDVSSRSGVAAEGAEFPELDGFVHEGGSTASVLSLVDRLTPLGAVSLAGRQAVRGIGLGDRPPATLPVPAAWDEGDFGQESGEALARAAATERALSALRYYDSARDYQPGLQRAEGRGTTSADRVLEFPGVFAAGAARSLLARAAARDDQRGEALAWRMAQLDPEVGPGTIVRAPGHAGLWQVTSWEWRERGVELELVRHVPPVAARHAADAGAPWSPPDRVGVETRLRVFELPWDGTGSSNDVQRFAALSAQTGRWSGATLYSGEGTALTPLLASPARRAVAGTLSQGVSPSTARRFEARASIAVQLEDAEALLDTVGVDDLARGANRMLVGSEILQFARAHALGSGAWRLEGLLRGRGATEADAMAGHDPGTPVTLLDDRLTALPSSATADRFAAIGRSDDEPVHAVLESPGRSRRPLMPVHGRQVLDAGGDLLLAWTRRARGGWAWLDEVDQPLVEQYEQYEVGLGDPSAPLKLWTVASDRLLLTSADLGGLPQGRFWVRQCGDFAKSIPLDLGPLPASPT